jgi:leucyl/phenylalanyl-tRNA---protein transferase
MRFHPLLLSIVLVVSSFAHAQFKPCEAALLQHEFSRKPSARDGIVTAKVPMTTASLIEAQRLGIFPWAFAENGNAIWYNPPMRGILDLNDMHISRSDMKFIRKHIDGHEYQVTVDKAFNEVVQACADQPREDDGTWLDQTFIDEYAKLFAEGYGHSVEVWKDGQLVGGVFGIHAHGVYSGQSMFHKLPDVTKLAFYVLLESLKAKGHTFIDTQMVVGLTAKWGGKMIPREEYLERLKIANERGLPYSF